MLWTDGWGRGREGGARGECHELTSLQEAEVSQAVRAPWGIGGALLCDPCVGGRCAASRRGFTPHTTHPGKIRVQIQNTVSINVYHFHSIIESKNSKSKNCKWETA